MLQNRLWIGLVFVAASVVPAWSATTEELEMKLKDLASQVQKLKGEVSSHESAEDPTHNRYSWLTIGGDFRVRHDVLGAHSVPYQEMDPSAPFFMGEVMEAQSIRNSSLLTSRVGLNLKAQVAEGISFKTRLVMQKVYGMANGSAFTGSYFSDRYGGNPFDGTVGKIPGNSSVVVEQAYADWANIGGAPVWFSAGRRPSTGGVPTNFRQNKDDEGVSGVNGLLVDYVFDGFSLGYAPQIAGLPGFATKLCAGRAFQAGFQTPATASTLKNTDMLGVVFLPMDTGKTRVDFQYQRAFNLMNTVPTWDSAWNDPMHDTTAVTANIGDIENAAGGFVKKTDIIGGSLQFFGYGGLSLSHPTPTGGLMFSPGAQSASGKQGWSAYTGLRYDLEKSRTKIGAEYNYGSKNWITFTPAADDVWTSKLGTRGNVYETYVIQELGRFAYAPKAKTFFRLGWQYYDFKHTGSNNWVGGAIPIKDVDPNNPATMQFFTPLANAYDIYTTFEVHF